ncbi:MAG: DUF1036 domain-containing protein [Acidobacteria bacterium]|nr:MAG: DUF1036 domain-containing protein [Acidobacteriota bacterium]REJ98054.1 MAG: DUF1036 domain-containing protein [Acidobacteriota bacterium]REK16797.1 MAG: DUF1036 domain-containing protein [Acidobacteriota bacterium]REK42708.1 MAG: DUF1036 domain-containing protein [Acidobacteriota bacterium]
MTKTRALFLSAIAFALLQFSYDASAQSLTTNPPVEIKNNSGETRKICFHKDKTITLFAIGCVELRSGENIFWDRKGVFTPFKVKIYQSRKILDKYLYSRDLPQDTGKIIVGTGGRFGFSRFKNIRAKYDLRVCNERFDDPVYFSLGLETNYGFWTEGWWSVKKGECKTIPVSQRLKEKHNIPYGTMPRAYYYARTYGDNPLYWSGGDSDYSLCLDKKTAFSIIQFKQDGSSQYNPLPCEGENRERTKFRRLKDPVGKRSTFYLTF